MARAAKREALGILGGSISAGTGVARDARYSALLARQHNLVVHNRAVGSTGSTFPSFCLDEIMPKSFQLTWLIIEFGPNDGQARSHSSQTCSPGRYAPLDP